MEKRAREREMGGEKEKKRVDRRRIRAREGEAERERKREDGQTQFMKELREKTSDKSVLIKRKEPHNFNFIVRDRKKTEKESKCFSRDE